MTPQEVSDYPGSVWQPTIPQQNDVSADVPQKMLKELNDLWGANVLLWVKLTIQSKTPALGGNGQGRDGRHFGPIAGGCQDRRLTSGSPCARYGGNEQEPTLVKEAQVGSKFYGFFLCGARRAVSSIEWLFRSVPDPVWWASGNSSPWHASASRHWVSCSECQTHDG